jgi:hypothetical protein
MELVTCVECLKQVTENSPPCLYCGAPHAGIEHDRANGQSWAVRVARMALSQLGWCYHK